MQDLVQHDAGQEWEAVYVSESVQLRSPVTGLITILARSGALDIRNLIDFTYSSHISLVHAVQKAY